MKDPHQIAAEAERIAGKYFDPCVDKDNLAQDIQSAIEKATEGMATPEEVVAIVRQASRAAHASEEERATGNSSDTELSRCQKTCQEQAEIIAGLHQKLAAHASEQDANKLAVTFHNIYERLAPDFGYETRKETRDFDPTTPNGRLMIAVCSEILKYHLPRAAQASEPWHPCEHCKQFGEWVEILNVNSYSVGQARDWDSAVSICEAHNRAAHASDKVVELYYQLLYQVERKWPNESRHETALRYIKEAERCDSSNQGSTL